ncbi:MAG: hypothetical protein LBV34_10905 [Nocardiopsaceae bacterium]|nr:hypothetical protein [Nocardiopsaceae bacterium]
MAASTSFRISETAKKLLASHASKQGTSATALLEQLIVEGVEQREYPGIVFRGPAHNRRAALAGGPDVWEVGGRLREPDGTEERRIGLLAEESNLHPRLIRLALDYVVQHPSEVVVRIETNRATAERIRATSMQRESLLRCPSS